MNDTDNGKFLLVKHSEGWDFDRCSTWMDKSRASYDVCYPASGQPLPPAEHYDGVIVFGSSASANDSQKHDWVLKELAFIETCMKLDKSFFGICLGAQMLARVMGAEVSAHPDNLKEIGFFDVLPTDAGADFLNDPLKFMMWHSEGFELPSGATHLAFSEQFENQAFKVGRNMYGVQFHPEVNIDVLRIWHERNAKRETGALDDATRTKNIADAIKNEDSITQWLGDFLTKWTLPPAS